MSGGLVVVATDRVSPKGLEVLTEDDRFEVVNIDDSSSDVFKEALGRASALIVRSATTVDDAMMAMAPRLAVVGRAGVGIDNIDLRAATARGIAVMNAPNGNTIAAAELTMALMLSAIRSIPPADHSVREGRWERSAFMGTELHGRTLGLVGAGRIGAEVAKRCQAFGMKVIAFDPYLTQERSVELGITLTGFDAVLDSADVISCHVPLNVETHGMISDEAFARMRPGVVLINVSRGGVVDEAALASALSEARIAGAALDVYESEPLPPDSPLRMAPNLVLTPHLGASTREAQLRVAVEVAEGIRAALLDGDLSAAVNGMQITR